MDKIKGQLRDEDRVLNTLRDSKGNKATVTQIKDKTKLNEAKVYEVLQELRRADKVMKNGKQWIATPKPSKYLDWNGNLDRMLKLREMGIPTLAIGEKGTGKSICTQMVAERTVGLDKLWTVNLSLRTRESHIMGRLDLKEVNGVQEVAWNKGPMPLSMEAGGILYLDELSAGEPDVLLRLDECLDDRRQLSYEGVRLKAEKDWWCVSSINPLTTPGTKELPPQLLSRFTARVFFDYPTIQDEFRIIKAHTEIEDKDEIYEVLEYFRLLRKTEELPYSPSIRESIAYAQMVGGGFEGVEALEMTALNPMRHWDESSYHIANDIAISMGLKDVVTESESDTFGFSPR